MDCFSSVSSLAQSLVHGASHRGRIRLPGDNDKLDIQEPVDILALGSGWTWSFLGPVAGERGLKTAFTTRDGREESIKFDFDPESDDTAPFEGLPDAKTIVIIFPLYSAQAARRIVHGYVSTRQKPEMRRSRAVYSEKASYSIGDDETQAMPRFILLGSTGIWNNGPTLQFAPLAQSDGHESYATISARKHRHEPKGPWIDRHDPIDNVPRAEGENALLAFNKGKHGEEGIAESSVLCLAGLWGHGRSPRRYVGRLAPTKKQLSTLGSVHLIHGHDVARAILAMHGKWHAARGQRWILTNERVYDLWDLISQWGDAGEVGRAHVPKGPQLQWIQELIAESREKSTSREAGNHVIRSLPRPVEQLGYGLDGTDFWSTFEIYPEVPWVD